MNHNTEPRTKQLSLFPIARDENTARVDTRPAPIQTADRFGFPLQHYAPTDNAQEYQYAIQDWIAGLTDGKTKTAADLWRKMKHSEAELSSLSQILTYTASDGKNYQRDFTNAKGLYLIAQTLRVTKARPQLKEIRDFLASSGAWVELIARDENAARVGIRQIAKHHKIRTDGIEKRNSFTDAAKESHIRHNPEYAKLTNALYQRLFRTATEYAKKEIVGILGLDAKQEKHFRDYLNGLALSAISMAEEAAAIRMMNSPTGLTNEEQLAIVRQYARMVAVTAHELAELSGVDLITGQPLLK